MKLQSIQLRHAYHFSDLKIDFNYSHKPITLILGQQASGKTAILKNIYQALTWFPARFKDSRTPGVVMLDSDIMHNRVQSKIDISVIFPNEIGTLAESTNAEEKDISKCAWKLYKTINANGIGVSKVDTLQLEQMASLYSAAINQDPLIGLPMIAYFPTDRFVNEMNLISKNNPAVFQNHSAYELAAIPYTTFARFFEWFREISDIENAQTAQLFLQLLDQSKETVQPNTTDQFSDFSRSLFQAKSHLHTPSLAALKSALNVVLPEITDIYLTYQPKLQLMVTYQQQTISFSQLSNSLRNWVALVGDVVRRLCLLNPKSLFPCMEGDGILIIDNIDAQLDQDIAQNILLRLNQAFPNVQIIATGCNEELLEHADLFQFLRLNNRKLEQVDLNTAKLSLDHIYQDLLTELSPSTEDSLSESDTTALTVEAVYDQVQQLSQEQQQALINLIRGDDSNRIVKL